MFLFLLLPLSLSLLFSLPLSLSLTHLHTNTLITTLFLSKAHTLSFSLFFSLTLAFSIYPYLTLYLSFSLSLTQHLLTLFLKLNYLLSYTHFNFCCIPLIFALTLFFSVSYSFVSSASVVWKSEFKFVQKPKV